ncbi:ERF family protein [Antrihabitans sp. YC2-6]|uniref:ERF family protein n=1 Tax=Antrihabitans sp. YC2-6 TaxID=2799498 RepID=UPI0018F329EA|nr:ERF family protein [Antrihabitans sp. YC2-6]MBJ8343970.1 ERF family protein [Antrihabitans sp. YC2-6]
MVDSIEPIQPTLLVIPPKIAKAIVQFQKDWQALERKASNDEYGSKYTPLEDVLAYAVPRLNALGVGVSQPPASTNEGTAGLWTILIHQDGDTYQTFTKIAVSKADPQLHVSSITYMRRKALESILGIASKGEDDDGNNAAGLFPKPTDEQLEQITSLCAAMKYAPSRIQTELKKVRTSHHAALVIRNLNERTAQIVRDHEAEDRSKVEINDGSNNPTYSLYDDPLLNRMIGIGLKTKAQRSRFLNRVVKKPFLEKCDAEERDKIEAELAIHEKAEMPPETSNEALSAREGDEEADRSEDVSASTDVA